VAKINVLVGLSGGIDSSLTMYLLKERGFNPIGVTMNFDNNIFSENIDIEKNMNTCLSKKNREAINEIRALTDRFNVPFYEIDLSKEFSEFVLQYFKNEYLKGKTPNPCIMCNKKIKFDLLLQKAQDMGISFDYFATGHYAKIEYDDKNGRYLLRKGIDPKKDQSYFLSLLSQDVLKKTIFPLGDWIKEDVRKKVYELNFFSYNKKESQDFYSGDLNKLFGLEDNLGGNIVNSNGKSLGLHNGLHNYTIGQRRGINIAAGKPIYVTKIDKEENIIVVGEESELFSSRFKVTNFNWVSIPPQNSPLKVNGRIRYRHKEAPCIITPADENSIIVEFVTPERAITPGQIFVAYNNDVVVGGGFINNGECKIEN